MHPESTRTTPVGALFGKVRQGVIGLLFGQPDQQFYQAEIREAVGARLSAVQRELPQLTGAGLLTATHRGNRVYYRANCAAALYPELRSLALKTTGLGVQRGRAVSAIVHAVS